MRIVKTLRRPRGVAPMAVALALVATFSAASPAAGAVLTEADELTRFGKFGAGAGEFELNVRAATDPVTGEVLLSSGSDARINEFTPWGEFVKGFGWGVAPGPVNEQQEVRVRAGAGQFRLGFQGAQTGDLPFDASGEELRTALDGLSTVQGAGGHVEVEERPGNAATETPYVYVVTFEGSLGDTDVLQLTIEDGASPLAGGKPATESEVRTRADGTAGTSGLEACTAESGCQAGSEGAGAGQVNHAPSLAADAEGDIFAADAANDRIQEYTPAGRFVQMLGGEVDKTEVAKREEQEANAEPVTVTEAQEDRCTAASGDECGAGVPGTGPVDFEQARVAIDPTTNDLLVANGQRIARFDDEGNLLSTIDAPGEVYEFAVDPLNGLLYVTLSSGNPIEQATKNNVRELDPSTGAEVGEVTVDTPRALAFDPEGNLYLVREQNKSGLTIPEAVLEFDSAGQQVSTVMMPEEVERQVEDETAVADGPAGDLYVGAYTVAPYTDNVRVFGPGPASLEAPPRVEPSILAQFAIGVEAEGAEVGGEINPHFWSDTRFFVEYGTGPCSAGGCARAPVGSEASLTSRVSGTALRATQELTGLAPATVYHYRFVAVSGGGGPVVGLDGGGGEGTFRTEALPAAGGSGCANESLRSGLAALLPDCRAFELVTPLEKGNGDVTVLKTTGGDVPAVFQESAVSGERLVYGSFRAFGDAESAPYTGQYVAQRGADGWASHAVSPPRTNVVVSPAQSTDTEFRLFSPDLCESWLVTLANPPLAPGAPEGEENLYGRSDGMCGGETSYRSLAPVLAGTEGKGRELELQGVAGEGAEAIYVSDPEVAGVKVARLYEQSNAGGQPLMLCVLPDGKPVSGACTAGGGSEAEDADTDGRRLNLAHAISADGSRVFWTASKGAAGPIYVRENPLAEGEECAFARSACTVAVSKQAELQSRSSGSRFWLASADGSRALLSTGGTLGEGEDLYRFDVRGQTTQLIAHKVLGVLGASEDAERVYLVSDEALTKAGNGSGAVAVEGQPNLYLYIGGEGESGEPVGEAAFAFIGTLARPDVEFAESDLASAPEFHLARVSADGLHAAFVSAAPLTGYDNTDLQAGEPDSEVYVYGAAAEGGSGQLHCASCQPGGARPTGRPIEGTKGSQMFAATIPGWENSLYATRVLSEDGSRVFFDSYGPLSARDTNGQEDVYEWEALAAGSCTEASATFSPSDGGCVSLISSGQSTRASQFVDASASGDDVFFATLASLLPQDPGLVDIYDARVDGGFPAAPGQVACEGEACQAPASPPAFQAPGSLGLEGEGNLTPPKSRTRHGKRRIQSRQLKRALRACRRKHVVEKRHACERRARKRAGTSAGKRAGHKRKRSQARHRRSRRASSGIARSRR